MRSIIKYLLFAVAGFLTLVVLLLVLMFLAPMWDRPPPPTTRAVQTEDLVGDYGYRIGSDFGDITLSLRKDGTFTQTIKFTHGQPVLTFDGWWMIDGAELSLENAWTFHPGMRPAQASLPAAQLGQRTPQSWHIIDSFAHKGGFAFLGACSLGPSHDPIIVEKK